MIEWSDTDLMVRDAVRQFVDKEIRPHLDELESGAMSPYPIARKLFSQFGLDTMAAEAVKKMLDRERSGVDENGDSSSAANEFSGGGAQGSMIAVLVSEIARVSIGLLSTASVSLGLGAATIASRGTLAQKERWLPELMTLEKIAAWAITEPDSLGCVRRHEDQSGAPATEMGPTSSTGRRPSSPTGPTPTCWWSTPNSTRATRRWTSATARCWSSCSMRACRA